MKFEIVFTILLLELLTVSWIDFRRKKISNYWILCNLAFATILFSLGGPLYALNWNILFFPVGFVGFGFVLFLLNIMGAGDSKYLASLFMVTPFEYQFVFFEKMIISTIVVGSILIGLRFLKQRHEMIAFFVNRHWRGLRDLVKSSFSYAPVVLVSWILLGIEIWK